MNTNEKKNSRMQTRIRNVLKEAGLTIDDLTYLDPKLLLYYRNFGLKSYNDILDIMKESGLTPGTFCSIPYVKGPCNRGDIIDYYKTHKIEIQNKNQIQSTKTVDYKKAYQEALELARKIHSGEKVDSAAGLSALETIFPELRESEDERIKKDIMEAVENWLPYERVESVRAYLEKRKEQKPTSFNEPYNPDEYVAVTEGNATSLKHKEQKPAWSEEDEKIVNLIVSILGQYIDYKAESGTGSGYATPRYSKEIAWLKSLCPQPKQDWSEEDETRYLSCLNRLETGNPSQPETVNSKWFKEHVHSRPFWKPSEEQMKALEIAFRKDGDDKYRSTINSLYNDLKKL